MNKKINILIVENSVHFTGAFRAITTLTKHLSDRFNFYYCLPTGSKLKEKVKTPVVTIPFVEIRKSLKSILLYIPLLFINSWRIIRYCERNNIQIIHVNDLYNLCGVVIKWWKPSFKVVYHVRLMPESYVKRFYRVWQTLISGYADAIICVSLAVRKASSFPPHKTNLIYDTHESNDELFFESRIMPNHRVTFIYLSNYIAGKGQDYAIEAFCLLNRKFSKSSLVFAGSDMGILGNKRFKRQLKERCNEYGLQDSVIFNDFVNDTISFIRSGDVLLNFSDCESFSMTVLEAMYAGLPVIATDSGGPAELIKEEETGLLVPVKDVEAMANAMLRLAHNVQLRSNMGAAARIRAYKKFSIAESAGKLTKLYQSLVE
ncbi:MAG: glycosyltransferase family 4 protein [Cyclobacteriaceae bacterium]|nr:glycosyltransferase family 4 protein [Cyclobacteriaceae bacterium]UYN87386.1 MAG: glycosyltransferase family 4 protein [Cyclobacteriaceae bacterium]